MYGLPKNVRVVPVIPVCIYEFESWITGVCFPYVVSV